MRTEILQVASIEVLHIEEAIIVWLVVLFITSGQQLSCRDVVRLVYIYTSVFTLSVTKWF